MFGKRDVVDLSLRNRYPFILILGLIIIWLSIMQQEDLLWLSNTEKSFFKKRRTFEGQGLDQHFHIFYALY